MGSRHTKSYDINAAMHPSPHLESMIKNSWASPKPLKPSIFAKRRPIILLANTPRRPHGYVLNF